MRYSQLLVSAALALGGLSLAGPAFAGGTHEHEKYEKNEKTVEVKDLPAAAQATVTRESKGGTLLRVEEMEKRGKTVYEAVIRKAKDEVGVVIDANGKVLERHSEKSETSHKH